jgi:hypothetical protein
MKITLIVQKIPCFSGISFPEPLTVICPAVSNTAAPGGGAWQMLPAPAEWFLNNKQT